MLTNLVLLNVFMFWIGAKRSQMVNTSAFAEGK